MDEKFHFERTDRGFGSASVSVADACGTFSFHEKSAPGMRPFHVRTMYHRLYGSPFLPASLRERMWRLFRRTRLDDSWFTPFQDYWRKVLCQRPLWGVEDLYFLRGYHRLHFQSLAQPEGATAEEHAAAYQRPESLYLLLHQVYKESFLNAFGLLRTVRKALGHVPASLLEYGCGTAPVANSFCDFYPAASRSSSIYLVDVKCLPLHYAAYKFRHFDNVRVIPLRPEDDLQLSERFPVEVVFCMTVFEHLNAPLETARRLHDLLLPGGLLVFDYIRSEGCGLDTKASLRERPAVIEFVRKNFEVVSGRLDGDQSLPTTIVRKER